MKIERVNENYLPQALEFLKNTSKIKDVDIKIVQNASIIIDDQQILGIISYEVFSRYALIRYFIFKKELSSQIIIELLNDISIKAQSNGIEALITIVNSNDLKKLFLDLGFYLVESEKVFIDEANINNTKFKDSYLLKYPLISYS